MKISNGAAGMVPVMVRLDVMNRVEPKPTPSWFPAPIVGPDMMMVCSEGGLESDEELNE